MHRHGIHKTITEENEFCKVEFQAMCDEYNVHYIRKATNDHQANGIISRANKTIKTFFRHLRSDDNWDSIQKLLSQAMFGKNICKGHKVASSFEQMYERSPTILLEL